MESKFTPGTEVVTVSSGGYSGYHRYGKVTKVAKVYKNGNFVLEEDLDSVRRLGCKPTQYRPDYNGDTADMCGQTSLMHRSWVVLYNEKTKVEIDKARDEQRRLARAEKLRGQFNGASFRHLTPHQLTELERLFDMYFPKV